MPLTLKDSKSFETQLIDAVRSVNRALGGSVSSARYTSDYNQYEVQLIDAVKGIGRTLSGSGLSLLGGPGGSSDHYIGTTKAQDKPAFQPLTGITTIDATGLATIGGGIKLSGTKKIWFGDTYFLELVNTAPAGATPLYALHTNLGFYSDSWVSAGGVGSGGGGGGGSSYLKELLDVYHDSSGILRSGGTAVQNGDTLVYDSTNSRWYAAAGGGGGGSSVSVSQSTSSGTTTTTITVDGTATAIAVKSVAFGTQASDRIPITIGATTTNVLTSHQSLSGYVQTSRQVNGHALTSDVTITKGDIGLGNVENTAISTWAGSANITTLGDITTGVWNGSTIGVTRGGTGLTAISKGDILYGSDSNTVARLSANGTSTKKFLTQSGSDAPAWGTIVASDVPDLSGTYVTLGTAQTITGAKTLSADLTLSASLLMSLNSYIDIGPARIMYDSNNGAIRITTNATTNPPSIGLYADGFVAAGGVGSGGGGGGAMVLNDLTDVTITSRTNGDVLSYSSSFGKWVNTAKAVYLSGYATESWVNGRGFLVSSDLSAYALKVGGSDYEFKVSKLKFGNTGHVDSFLSADAYGLLEHRPKWTYTHAALTPGRPAVTENVFLAFLDDIPEELPNPQKLYFGSTSSGQYYDGSLQMVLTASLLNAVTLDTAQTITGAKTFSAGTVFGDDITLSTNTKRILGTLSGGGTANMLTIANDDGLYIGANSLSRVQLNATGTFMFYWGSGNKYVSFGNIAGSASSGEYCYFPNMSPNNANASIGLSSDRWANIYGVNANLSGDLAMADNSTITLGPVTITYDAVNKALHISGTDGGQTIGFYCDGFVSAGGTQGGTTTRRLRV